MTTADLFETVRRVETRPNRLVNDLVLGAHQGSMGSIGCRSHRSAELNSAVSRICNPHRLDSSEDCKKPNVQPNEIRRYGRLKIRATHEAQFRLQSEPGRRRKFFSVNSSSIKQRAGFGIPC